jgi:AcrR family transcriptional regulator
MADPPRTRPGATDAEQGGSHADARARLLAAAARVYAQHGYTGATTRRIAREADVNEVTLFRLFRSKDALVDEAVRAHTTGEFPAAALPGEPVDPERELVVWCTAEVARLRESGELVRQCFANAESHPEHLEEVTAGITSAARELRSYVERLHRRELIQAPQHAPAATSMLVSALLSDALAREQMPDVYPHPAADAPASYVRAFLAALRLISHGENRT